MINSIERLKKGDLCEELHPVNSEEHALGDIAREIVGHFHSKGDLVQVVTVLLIGIKDSIEVNDWTTAKAKTLFSVFVDGLGLDENQRAARQEIFDRYLDKEVEVRQRLMRC